VRRGELEHVIRAAAEIVSDEIVVIGSQAVVGGVPDPPAPLVLSMEADVFPLHQPERAIEIDSIIGDGSRFHDQFGYYAHGVGPETAHAPAGWQQRTVRLELPAAAGWKTVAVGHCMRIDDVVLAKLVAGREKDFVYAEAALWAELVDPDVLRRGLPLMNNADGEVARANLEAVLARLLPSSTGADT